MAVCNNLYQDLKTGVGWEFALSSSILGILSLFLPHPPWLLLAPPFNPPCLTNNGIILISVCAFAPSPICYPDLPAFYA